MKLISSCLIILMLSGISYATELNIGLIPEQHVFKQIKRYRPLGAYIEKKTDIGIKFTVLSRYGNIIENFKMKNLDGAFLGSFTGALAIKKLSLQPIARPINLHGTSSYRGHIFVHKQSRIDSVERMKDSVIAFVDKATTAGYIFPVAYFKENGVINIDNYFKEYFFTGSHDAAIHAVLNKEAEVGCAKNTIYEMLARDDSRVKDNLVILATSADVPSNGLSLRSNMAIAITQKLKRVLLEMDSDPEGKEVLKNFGVIRFIETTKEDYAPVFDLAKKAGIDLKKYDYKNE